MGRKKYYGVVEMNVFSFDLSGDFAFFKKNDMNDKFQTTYNFIHKPAILGIIGAILGKKGYASSKNKAFPEYYIDLKHLKVAIQPHYTKPLKKIMSVFNNSSGLASKEEGAWQIKEQILVGEPIIKYTIYILDNNNLNDLKIILKNGETAYTLYFGKNEFPCFHDNYQEWISQSLQGAGKCNSLFIKDSEVETESLLEDFDPLATCNYQDYSIYEYLPLDFDNNGFYKKELFVLTNSQIDYNNNVFYQLKNDKEAYNVQFI